MRLAVVCRTKGARELTQAPSMTPSGLIGARPLTRWAFEALPQSEDRLLAR